MLVKFLPSILRPVDQIVLRVVRLIIPSFTGIARFNVIINREEELTININRSAELSASINRAISLVGELHQTQEITININQVKNFVVNI